MKYDCFSRYLTAKKTVDDRSLNGHVFEAFKMAVSAESTPIRMLEVGCGNGTMIERLLDLGVLTSGHYVALDRDETNLIVLRHRLKKRGFVGDDLLVLDDVTVEPVSADIFTYTPSQPVDVLLAHAVLDLFDLSNALPQLLELIRPNGHYYFTLNFDGITTFQPAINATLDAKIERLYHATMDEGIPDGRPPGDSRSGRHLLRLLQQLANVVAAGSSDWVVLAQDGAYASDEAYFLHFIVDTIADALSDHAELKNEPFAQWISERHAQIERGELIYIAHQLDVFGRTHPI